jgi:hypothetical protein
MDWNASGTWNRICGLVDSGLCGDFFWFHTKGPRLLSGGDIIGVFVFDGFD